MNTVDKTFTRVLQSSPACDRISVNKKRVVCPICHKQTLLFLLPSTEAKSLPVWCKRCNQEIVLDILPEPEPKSLSH